MDWAVLATGIGTIAALVGAIIALVQSYRDSLRRAVEEGRMKQRQEEVECDVNNLGKKLRGHDDRLRMSENTIAALTEQIKGVHDEVHSANEKLDRLIERQMR